MNMIESRKILIQETRSLLQTMQFSLIDIEENASRDQLNDVFRAVHTIKGSAGIFGFDLMVNFTHTMEKLLVRIIKNQLCMDMSIASLLANCGDYINTVFNTLEETGELIDVDPVLLESLIYQLNYYIKKPISDPHHFINNKLASIRS
jgi:two-component system, chemotaxis family, sensor kinase CheA